MTTLWDAIDATWAAPQTSRSGPFLLREGQGGGQRVSAATADGTPDATQIAEAASAMRALGQRPLFMVRGDQTEFDQRLQDEGYDINDPVVVMTAPIDRVAQDGPPPVTAFPIWPPLQIMCEIWDEGGIGPARRAIMAGSVDPKTAILGRARDRAAGCAFVARPAAETPLSALALGVLADRAGLPKGILSIIPSSRSSDIGKEFCENPAVRKLTFTGSTEVGRILLKQAADQVMKCSMELGGNAPFIVFDDADLDAAVEGAMIS